MWAEIDLLPGTVWFYLVPSPKSIHRNSLDILVTTLCEEDARSLVLGPRIRQTEGTKSLYKAFVRRL
jgi:hypothetical protein